jgi:hypothetical protein
MAGIFEVATNIATPLGLAGIMVVVLFLVYRQLIKGPLAAQLSQRHSFHIINRIVIGVFVLGLVAIVLAIGAYVIGKVLPAPQDAMLRMQKHLDSVQTGGDAYAYFMLYNFDMQRSIARDVVLIRQGKYPLYDVRIRIRDMDAGRDVFTRAWGEISAPAEYLPLVRWSLPPSPSVYYRVFLHARNGQWHQDLILKRSDALQYWVAATRVFDKRGKEVVFEHIDTPDFVNEFGAPTWRQ